MGLNTNSLECQKVNLLPANRPSCASSGKMLAVRLAYKSSSLFFPEREAGAADFLCFLR